MAAGPANVREVISSLSNVDQPIQSAALADLSNIGSDDLSFFTQTWTGIEVSRRRKFMNRLVELAEENFELNFDVIFKNCLRDADAEVRAKAIEGLWEDEETTLITPFIKLLNEDTSELVQAAAAKALSKYAMLAELKKLGPNSSSRVSQALLTILADKSKPVEVWRRALEAAAPLSVPEVKQAIADAYKNSNLKVKNSAIFAMGRNCDTAWLPILVKELSSPEVDTRYEAAGACGEVCDDVAVPPLIKLTQDKDIEVQQAAIIALGKIGGNKAKQTLLKLKNSPDELVSDAAEQALKQIEAEQDSFIL
jgi:HEAT repeat protein